MSEGSEWGALEEISQRVHVRKCIACEHRQQCGEDEVGGCGGRWRDCVEGSKGGKTGVISNSVNK